MRSGARAWPRDCQADDLPEAATFWSKALGAETRETEPGYVGLSAQPGINIEVRQVEHPSRVHLDIAADDVPAEVARLESLGARRVAAVKTWVVMEAPTGQRFCVIRAKRDDFAATATAWED